MLHSSRSRTAAVLVAALVSLGTLSGCAADAGAGAAGGELTLTAIKSPIQLLRNEAAGRIPSAEVSEIVQPTDKSSACKPSAEDPDDLWRTWESGVLTIIRLDSEKSPEELQNDLIASFEEEGWVEGDAPAEKTTRLVKDTTFATIDLSFVKPDLINEVEGQIQVTTAGPCVETEGPDSAEVRKLENKD